jgi:hypothetical protein
MASRWFYRLGDQEWGPVAFHDLAALVRTGRLTENDRVRRDVSQEWTAASEVIGLFRTAEAQTPVGDSARSATALGSSKAVAMSTAVPAGNAKGGRAPPAAVAPAARTAENVQSQSPAPGMAAPRRRRRPLGRRAWLGMAGGTAAVLAAIAGYKTWSNRQSRVFPDSALRHPRLADNRLLETIRTARPKLTSIPGLEQGVAKPVPGLEGVDPGYSPCLTADLRTIVYGAMPDVSVGYDLYTATRDDVSQPFGPARRIEACCSADTELSPTLSPEGLELFFMRSDRRPRCFHATRETTSAEFGEPKLWKIPDYDPEKKQRVERPQFLDRLHLVFCFVELDKPARTLMVAPRSEPKAPFGPLQRFPISNAWPPWFISANGLRAYYGSEEGLFVAARESASTSFGEAVKLADGKDTGPIDGPIWVAPQEDVVFYVSPGPGKKPGLGRGDVGRKLWMIWP